MQIQEPHEGHSEREDRTATKREHRRRLVPPVAPPLSNHVHGESRAERAEYQTDSGERPGSDQAPAEKQDAHDTRQQPETEVPDISDEPRVMPLAADRRLGRFPAERSDELEEDLPEDLDDELNEELEDEFDGLFSSVAS